MEKRSQLDRMFERGIADVSRAPQTPLSDEQIATAAKKSRTGVVLWMRMHVKEILACVILLSVGIAGTLLVSHFTGNQESTPEPAETVAAVVCDTTMSADDPNMLSDEPTTTVVETQCIASLQTNQSANVSAKPNTKPAATTVETYHGASLQNDQSVTTSAKFSTEPTASPVIVKKTIVQRDTVVINETVTIKDTVYLMDN